MMRCRLGGRVVRFIPLLGRRYPVGLEILLAQLRSWRRGVDAH